jgi:hypothetical protein
VRKGEVNILASLGGVLCAVLTYTARYTLNADGVSYLDLAARLPRGDLAHFVQGYWSPLYPALLALASAVTGLDGAPLIPTVHLVNGLFVVGTLGIIWVWARQVPNAFFARASLAALLLCSAGAPRVEAITPDLLLLLVLAGLSYELIVPGGRRWFVVGVLLGLAFLAKTSVWPWLAIASAVRLWGARDRSTRRGVIRSTAVCAALMLVWIVPMSLKDQRFTLGSAGRLNVCWYLGGCDSRTPDTHTGTHVNYRDATTSTGEPITWVGFDDAARWTYQPWSDPTAWDRGVGPRLTSAPDALDLLMYWITLAGRVFGQWLLPLFLAVLFPMLWVGWRPGMWRSLATDHRDALVVMILGLLGLGQFIAVHAEPRLIAPFALMLALGTLSWVCPGAPGPLAPDRQWAKGKVRAPSGNARGIARQVAASIGLAVALGFLIDRIGKGVASNQRITLGRADLEQTVAMLGQQGIGTGRIAIIGPAMPVTATAYWVGGHIVAQVPPRSAATFAKLAPAERQQALNELFADRADVAWLTNPNGEIQMIPIQRARER